MQNFKYIDGGVALPKGFTANGIHCGIRKNKDKKDLSLIFAECRCSAAAVYTTNKVKGAPIAVTKEHLSDGYAQAMICNSGIANTCSPGGEEKARKTCEAAAKELGISPDDVIVASTGVIGAPLNLGAIENGIPELVKGLSKQGGKAAVLGIMTTDTHPKEKCVEFELDGQTCRIGGIAKGSGMIHPNMATMLSFITTDVLISPEMLNRALRYAVADSFNMVSVDGDTSTNDMMCVMASGLSGNAVIEKENEDYTVFAEALRELSIALAREIAADGEGATKLIVCNVKGAADDGDARKVAKSVICSPLVKTAMYGADANWGRVICAAGYSGVEFDPFTVDISFRSGKDTVDVCKNGEEVEFDDEFAAKLLSNDEINIDVTMREGGASATAFGCDLTYEYVKINGEYRT